MHKLTMGIVAGATAAVLASPAVAEWVYVYRDAYPVAQPQVIIPATPAERVYVDRPNYAYDSYYVWDATTRRYEPRYRYRILDETGRSHPQNAQEASRLYGYPYGFDGNPGYLYWDGHGIALAPDRGLTRDSNPNDYTSGRYNPKP